VGTIYTMGERLEEVVRRTMADMAWESNRVHVQKVSSEGSIDMKDLIARIGSDQSPTATCLPIFHTTRSCTTCSDLSPLTRDCGSQRYKFKMSFNNVIHFRRHLTVS
jgi:hypothetical protein